MVPLVSGLLAAAVCAALLYAGRRDLTHPAVAFGAVWFLFVAAAQLELTGYQHEWSATFAVVAIAGGLAFVAGAGVAAGTGRLRGGPPRLDAIQPRSLVLVAVLLLLGGVAGLAWKASILGGVPLFSGDVDVVRSRAYGFDGGSRVPAPSTFLTNGFHIAAWCALLATALRWRDWSRLQRAAALAFTAVCVVGAFAGGSRNSLLFALAVPIVVAYLCSGRMPRRHAMALGGVVLVLVATASFVFAARISQRGGSGETFYARIIDEQPTALRPLMPVYIAGTYGLETYRRAFDAFPQRFSYTAGGSELTSMPDAAFPKGKPRVGGLFGALSWDGPGAPTWTVASYQGRAYADFGPAGALLVSLLFGLLLGAVYRIARERRTLWALVAAAFSVYVAAFMVYDNLLSFSVAVVYDLTVVAVALAIASGRLPTARRR
ncbi:MAG TPA: O-antigen polymerase [Solirubrobacteraceae bacterium]|nr:O-antigen polymerase [Solirubrobacteraceae bacterium]